MSYSVAFCVCVCVGVVRGACTCVLRACRSRRFGGACFVCALCGPLLLSPFALIRVLPPLDKVRFSGLSVHADSASGA